MTEDSPQEGTATIFRVRELELRYKPGALRAPFTGSLHKSADVARLARDLLENAAIETVLVLHVNNRNKLVGVHRIPGTLGHVAVSAADICRAALLSNARGVIFIHNHLSGDPSPSGEDHRVVFRVRDATLLLDIELLDALVVVDPTESELYYSFRDSGQL